MTPPAGLLLVAYLHGEPVGCGALILLRDDIGLVKRMWVAPKVSPFNDEAYADHWFEKPL